MGHGRVASKNIDMAKSVNEQSPLLPPRTSEEIEDVPPLDAVFSPSGSEGGNSWVADAQDSLRQETKSNWYLFLLTLAMGG